MRRMGWGCWLGLLVVLFVVGSRAAHGAQATLVADAHVNAARPAVNSGAISNVNVGAGIRGCFSSI